MSSGVVNLRKQIADLRALAAQLAAPDAGQTDEDAVAWAERTSGLVLDNWQKAVLLSDDPRLGLLCCRQSGKSTIVALKAADIVRKGGLAVAVSPSLRQSGLLYRKIQRTLFASGDRFARSTAVELELGNGGTAISLPGDRVDLLRGLSLRWPTTSMLLVDEASRVRDSMWAVISPMLAAAPQARQTLLSTPAGASGEFHRIFTGHGDDWRRITVTAEDCGRISSSFLKREKVRLGEALFDQEYRCKFIASPGSVFSADVLAAMFGEVGDDAEREDRKLPTPAPDGTSRFVL